MEKQNGPTEKEILDAILRVGKRLSEKFRFGYYEAEDIQQELSIVCLKAMKDYDGKRSLDNYLWVTCKNRLCNLKRNKYERLESPCSCCFLDNQNNGERIHKESCEEYENWLKKTKRKKDLVNKAIGGELAQEKVYEETNNNVDIEKISQIIDKELPVHLREDYFKYKYGIKLKQQKKRELLSAIHDISKRFNLQEM